ncbi:hypothetical protein GCM10011579_072730 [Streptomyces albiflavescens]|uniref:Uncharacterized protein n=1 Tax=Streptomyces albiflavescens TaxID=1623582 RepID=A0A918D8R8_9ACTN|nr:hypothetical protein [Streptomyces albiflavescens]GGN83686.1 hypothetical protein GCM10011579_072730 [Streptomyces albiflavescens]
MVGMNHVEDLPNLTELCPPPSNPVPSLSGRTERVSRTIPADHYDLTRVYGTGCFDEFLWIFAAGADNPNLDIDTSTDAMQSILRGKDVPTLREILTRHRTVPEELIQWGVTDNGDSLLWIPVGDPGAWSTVIIQAGQLDFVISPRSSTGVVLDLLTGALRVRFFPEDFPSGHPEFSTNPYV